MLNRDFRDMFSALFAEKAEFLIVGAYALAAHGIPRATGDLDFWIRRSEDNAHRVLRALGQYGASMDDIKLDDLLLPDLVFQMGVEPTRIDIPTSIDGVEFDEAWNERDTLRMDGLDIPLVSIRHLIQNKQAMGRPKDIADLAAIEEMRTRDDK